MPGSICICGGCFGRYVESIHPDLEPDMIACELCGKHLWAAGWFDSWVHRSLKRLTKWIDERLGT